MDIFLVRHGESTGNGKNCFLGWSDHPLTECGEQQAQAAAARLASLGPMPVRCSDLPRARTTAERIAERWQGLVEPDARWREICSGQYEGLPWERMQLDEALTRQFEADAYNTPMPGGESVAMMVSRVCQAFSELLGEGHARVAIVTHDGPIRAVLAHCLQIPPERFWTLATEHGGLTHITVLDNWLTVRSVNDTSHLMRIPCA